MKMPRTCRARVGRAAGILVLHGLGCVRAFIAPHAAFSCRPGAMCRTTSPWAHSTRPVGRQDWRSVTALLSQQQTVMPSLCSVQKRRLRTEVSARHAQEQHVETTLLRPPARGPTLHVYLFVTIVGWGKNTLLDEMLPELRGQDPCPTWHLGGGADSSDEGTLPGLFEGPEMQSPRILESDTIGAKRFWSAVQEAVCDNEGVHHLFLNKNFPPNAWPGARRKLLEYSKTSNRPLILYAIVPKSLGAERNAFNLVDLGICLSAVQSRAEHPNLGKESPVTASVAATFYNLYNFRKGREEFLARLKADLTDNVIDVDWLDSEAYSRAPAALPAKMSELILRMGQARTKAKAKSSKYTVVKRRGSSGGRDGKHARGAGGGQRPQSVVEQSKKKMLDDVAIESAALEEECRALMCQIEVAEFVRGARLPRAEVLRSLERSTRLVRERLAL